MDETRSFLILAAIGLSFLVTLGTILFLYLKWVREAKETLLFTEVFLNKKADRQMQSYALAIQEYDIYKQPYKDIVTELKDQKDKADEKRKKLEELQINLYNRLNTNSSKTSSLLLSHFLDAQDKHVLTNELHDAQSDLETSLKNCNDLVKRLRDLPKEMHTKVSEAVKKMDEFQSLLGKMK